MIPGNSHYPVNLVSASTAYIDSHCEAPFRQSEQHQGVPNLIKEEEGALTNDGLAIGLEHGPAHHGSTHDDKVRE
jgi:hypothetical protein